jgi:hypothetical protein
LHRSVNNPVPPACITLQIDQSTDPTRVTIAGSPQSLQLAVSMVNDIVRGTFKGFAMLRQIALTTSQPGMPGFGQPQPVYVQGYGFVPPSQVYNPDDPLAAAQMLRSSPPTGPLTPPMTPLRTPAAGALGTTGLTPEAIIQLLGQQQGGGMAMQGLSLNDQSHGGGATSQGGSRLPPALVLVPCCCPYRGHCSASCLLGSQRLHQSHASHAPALLTLPPADALLGQLLGQLAGQQSSAPTMNLQQHHQQHAQLAPQQANNDGSLASGGGADPATIQALLAQAGLLGAAAGQPVGSAGGMNTQALPSTAGIMLNAGAASVPASSAPGSAFHAGGAQVPLSAGSSSPAHSSASVPVTAAPAGNAYRPTSHTPASYLGTSPTATHSSGDTGELHHRSLQPALGAWLSGYAILSIPAC